jgi:protein phosphatase
MLEGRLPTVGTANGKLRESIPAAISDIGCEREINEDRYAVIDSPTGRAWIVCDGMGGSLGGDLAAQLAIDAIRRGLNSRDFESPEEAIKSAIDEANRVIVLRRQNPAFSNMGTTTVAAIIEGEEVVIANAGDSRAYLVRGNTIEQLTIDHTYVQDLVDRGTITPDEAMSHPQAHVLTRCVGAEPRLNLDLSHYWIWDLPAGEHEDKLVLCSDGLYSLVGLEEIAEAVSSLSPQESCIKLVDLAKERGGYDNITLAVLPLGGQLREESPSGTRRALSLSGPRKRVATTGVRAPKLSMSRQIVLMFVLLVLGALATALVLVMKLIG